MELTRRKFLEYMGITGAALVMSAEAACAAEVVGRVHEAER